MAHDFKRTVSRFLGTLAQVYSGREMPADELDAFVVLFLEQAGPPKQEAVTEEEPRDQEYEDKMRPLLEGLEKKGNDPRFQPLTMLSAADEDHPMPFLRPDLRDKFFHKLEELRQQRGLGVGTIYESQFDIERAKERRRRRW
ncbi:hypothetical protein KKC88_01385 [Patescibacteria group bacterium]|nr:hypothetical protein [Patescibacteria group bacterium]MBU1673480.1 hypothetical protein [Patescibacteria group bacterium]MBU1963989.1 hypothetical protein [Patescibacteria group bacterium]